jgi:hypothetical protein
VSRRHRDGRDDILHKGDRLAEHRRKRRVARQVLATEGDEAVVPYQGHDHLHAHRSGKPVEADAARRARRHWKQPFWKRRMAQRRMKAEAFRQVADV